MENAAERARRALDSLVYLPSLKGHSSKSGSQSSPPGPGRGHHPCRTWDRGDLLRRLHSFKSSTWFCKPPGAGPMECARRGWVNHSMDMLSCEFCGARLSLPLPPTLPPEEVTKIGREFSERLASAHDTGCPWVTSACDPSLAQFPPLDRSLVAADFAAREIAVGRLNVLPPIAEDAYARIIAIRRSRLHQLLVHGPQKAAPRLHLTMSETLPESPTAGASAQSNGDFRGFDLIRRPEEPTSNDSPKGSEQPAPGIACQGTPEFVRRQRFLALCGWDILAIRPDAAARSGDSPRPLADAASRNGYGGGGALDATGVALGCEMCGARAGLWDFVPRMVPPARPGARLVTAGLNRRDHAPRAATRMTDLSRTIAGGSLSPDQAPSSSPPGPFGASSTTPLSFGAWTPATSAQSPGPSRHTVPGTSQRNGTVEISTPGGVFGSPSAALPAFGTPASSPAPSTPAASAPHPSPSTPFSASLHPFGSQPMPVSTAMPTPGPFGSSAAAQSPVFGLAAIAAAEGTRSTVAPISGGSLQEGSSSAAGAPAAGSAGGGPFGVKTGPPPPVFGLAALQARAAAIPSGSSAVATTPQPVPKRSLDHPDGGHTADTQPPSSKRPRLSQAAFQTSQQKQQQQEQQNAADSSFSFPVLPAAADATAPKPIAFPALTVPAGAPAAAAAAPLKPVSDPFSPRSAQQLQAFDPLLFHRTFCPWVNTGSDSSSSPGGKLGRCGWRWCLDSLVPEPGPEEERDNATADDPRSKVAAVLRKLRAP
ncbi:probable nuclear-interacting partner of ALK at N-terminal half [Coccomyxa sp. Obi]|nr:probable nuclear-interacting partner of ALK at N-terminal half [Coccomyxa sp. Obi]